MSNANNGAEQAGRSATTKHGIMLLLAAVMPPMAIITLVPVLPLLMREFSGVEGFQFLVPIAMTIPALCVALFSPLAGWISDRVGRKNLLITALVLYAGIGVVPFFLSDIKQIIVARIILGVAEAVIMTIATALIGDYFKGKERERWVALQIATVSLSAIVLIAVGGILGEVLGSRGPFLLYLLALPVAAAIAIILFEPERSASSLSTASDKLPLARILPLLLTTLFVGIIFYTIIVKLGVILGLSADVSPGQIGAIGAAANVGVALGSVLFGRFKGASGPMLVLIGLVLAAAGYMGAGLSTSLAMTTVSVIIASLGFGMLLPTMLTWVLQLLPENVRGRGTGLWTGVFFFGQFFAPLLAAGLQNQLGGLANVLLLFAGLCALGVVVAAFKLKGAESLLTK
ncbi:MFS transporter [Arenicella xantha]|uniref:Putative MFS family arabinose efflux permease n=1 Tax=Arenicella xantha TaxID=644221 RepID=A0A395JHB8_9GAMM|nr:MFS transporter [Arenicella xantha]RBP47184.1 putative MFS family arabinose efflux permease [Arenicella xantha]